MCWPPTYRLHKLKCADELLAMVTRIQRKRDKRNVSRVLSSVLFGSLALITLLLPGTPQTNSRPGLIRSSTENVFVERKETFRTENAGDTGDSRVFVFLKMAALAPRGSGLCWLALKRPELFPPVFFPL